MSKETLLIIGGGDAGMTTASWARRRKPDMNIIVFEKTHMISHAPCGLPYYIEGLFDNENLLSAYTPEEFEKERNVNVKTNHEVVEFDFNNRIVYVKNKNGIDKYEYDYLTLAMGAKPKKVRHYDEDSNIIYVHHPANAVEVKKRIAGLNNIAILGGGILGVELAEALLKNGKNVFLIHKNNYLLDKMLDEDMASFITKYVSNYVKLRLNEEALEIKNGGKIIITNNNKYEVDGTIVAIGVEPNTDLVDKRLLGETRAIKTDEYMRTKYKDVYAVGDIAESINILTKKPDWQPFAPVAGKMGFTAGNHIGGVNYKFPGLVGTAITKYKDYFIAKTGLTEKEAKKNGIKTISTIIKSTTRARYYPGGKDIIVKLIAEENTQKIIGGQIIGSEEVLGRIDMIALAIMKSNTLYDLFYLEHAYVPAISRSWDPVILAARSLLTKF